MARARGLAGRSEGRGRRSAAALAHAGANGSIHAAIRVSTAASAERDRVDSDTFPITQEFLGQMLGVHRPAVSVAGAALQDAGLIEYSRGRISIVDRKGLVARSCECYARIRRDLEKVFDDIGR